MNGSSTRLAASLIEDRHREAAAARRAEALQSGAGVRPSALAGLLRVLAQSARPGRALSVRRAELPTER
jgi:hypothetical protein